MDSFFNLSFSVLDHILGMLLTYNILEDINQPDTSTCHTTPLCTTVHNRTLIGIAGGGSRKTPFQFPHLFSLSLLQII